MNPVQGVALRGAKGHPGALQVVLVILVVDVKSNPLSCQIHKYITVQPKLPPMEVCSIGECDVHRSSSALPRAL